MTSDIFLSVISDICDPLFTIYYLPCPRSRHNFHYSKCQLLECKNMVLQIANIFSMRGRPGESFRQRVAWGLLLNQRGSDTYTPWTFPQRSTSAAGSTDSGSWWSCWWCSFCLGGRCTPCFSARCGGRSPAEVTGEWRGHTVLMIKVTRVWK